MSKSKRNIAYIKPQDPSFLAKLKQEIGYKEAINIDAKKQKLEDLEGFDSDCEERPEREDEKPQIVVLKVGDLTAEEAAAEEKRVAKEASEAPADLNQPIVFRKRHKPKQDSENTLASTSSSSQSTNSEKTEKSKKGDKRKKTDKNTAKLSFNADEEEDEED